ncbi:MAG: polysaccharide deacetylase family protein [Pseudomonadota bacterium]|nr:polysaccharide deacetylase family protein [Pseudomonadota bacterium]
MSTIARPAARLEAWVLGLGAAGMGAGLAAGVGILSPDIATAAGLVALGGLLGGVTVASARPELELFGPCVKRGRHPGRAAITIDDGPHPISTAPMLEALARAGAHATFFVLADRVQRHPELFRAMVDGGHEIGLHGLSHHPWLTVRRPVAGAAELAAAMRILAAHGSPPIRWYRPPFGATSPRVYAAAHAAGLSLAWCSVRTLDGVPIRAETLRARCRAVVGTDIVLLHEGPGPTSALLPEILDEWHARGIAASSLSEALEGAAA